MQITTSVPTTRHHQFHGKARHIYSWPNKLRPRVKCLKHKTDLEQVSSPRVSTPWPVFQSWEKTHISVREPTGTQHAQQAMEYEDKLVIHATRPFEALGHDLTGFTIGHNFFPRSSSVLNGKRETRWKRKCSSKRMCEFWPRQRGKNSTAKQKMMLGLTQIKEERAHDWSTVIEKPLNQHKKLLRKQIQESYSHDKSLNLKLQSQGMFNRVENYL